jgi:GT2 family glycosyltransferase
MGDTVPASVIVPTIGRVRPLQTCLEAVAACTPGAAEILVVDQSGDPAVVELVGGFSSAGARVVDCSGRGVSRGRNVGIREAANEVVLVTDDDCTVAIDWIGKAWELMAPDTTKIVTGQVLPVGDARAVPSTKDDPEAFDFTGLTHGGALFPNNMALGRSHVLAFEGFDERFGPEEAAEDNEFCYRWLKAGRTIRYEPSLVVWHHDWRTPSQLEQMYIAYARGQGFFYAKHLRRGDPTMIRWIFRDVYWGLRGLVAALLGRHERWTDPRRGIPRGLPVGLWRGFRTYWRR